METKLKGQEKFQARKYFTPPMHEWCALPADIRSFIKKQFQLPQTGRVSVVDNKIICDGTMPIDFQEMTFIKMKKFTRSLIANQLEELYDETIEKVKELLAQGITEPILLTEAIYEKTGGNKSTKKARSSQG